MTAVVHDARRTMQELVRLRVAPLALGVSLVACGNDRDTSRPEPANGPVVSSCGEEEEIAVTGGNHVVPPVNYPDDPPVGGDHDQCWAAWGVHTEPVPPERWVHNLEHGGVVFLHDCASGCGSEQAALDEIAGFVAGNGQALMTPYADLPGAFAVVAWGWRLVLDCIDVAAVKAFYDAHVASPDLLEGNVTAPPPAGCE
jgi:hypothetical protein